MSNETIMLAKSWTPGDGLLYPVHVTEKLDGVACKFTMTDGIVNAISRSGKMNPVSVQHICDFLASRLYEGCSLIGELYIPGKPFKAISGLVRQYEDAPELQLYIYDFVEPATETFPFAERMHRAKDLLCIPPVDSPVYFMLSWTVFDHHQLMSTINHILGGKNVEGVVIREQFGKNSRYAEGKRSKGMLKYKPKPTVDLPVVYFEEAHSKDGVPLGMVGRIGILYKGEEIGCGPGKLTHTERKEIWVHPENYIKKIAEVEYMRDDSYTALRQPTFQRWRDDKLTTNEEIT